MSFDLWDGGALVYAGIVILANLRILYDFSIYTGIGEILVIGSIMSYFIIYYLENLLISVPVLFG